MRVPARHVPGWEDCCRPAVGRIDGKAYCGAHWPKEREKKTPVIDVWEMD